MYIPYNNHTLEQEATIFQPKEPSLFTPNTQVIENANYDLEEYETSTQHESTCETLALDDENFVSFTVVLLSINLY